MNCILRLFVALTMVIAVQSDAGDSTPGFTCKDTQAKSEASCYVQKDDSGTSKYYVALASNTSSTDGTYSCNSVKIQDTAAQGTACCALGTSANTDPQKDTGMAEDQFKSACSPAAGKTGDQATST